MNAINVQDALAEQRALDSKETERKVLNRLRRASGQLQALIRAVEEGKTCKEVVTQLSAVSSALDRAGYQIVLNAMKDCLAAEERDANLENTAEEGHAQSPGEISSIKENAMHLSQEELEKLFLSLA